MHNQFANYFALVTEKNTDLANDMKCTLNDHAVNQNIVGLTTDMKLLKYIIFIVKVMYFIKVFGETSLSKQCTLR